MAAIALNPHKNPLRNLKKKVESVKALKGRTDLDDDQKEKLKNEKKLVAELTAMEKKYNDWEAANAAPQKEQAKGQQKKAAEKPVEKKKGGEKKEAAPAPVNTESLSTEQSNKLRNLKKKLHAIEELQEKVNNGFEPDKAQKDKLATKKDIVKQINEIEKQASKGAKKEEKKEAPKKDQPAKKDAPAKKEQPAKKAAPQKEGQKKGKEAAPAAEEPKLDPKAEKTMRNRVKNLKAKLESIAELKSSEAELSPEQVTKVKSEKKVKAELDELSKKFAAFGLTA